MKYYYESQVGPMFIYFDRNEKVALQINGTVYGHYSSAVAAADDVYCHATGCDEWDALEGTLDNAPTDIYEWDKVKG